MPQWEILLCFKKMDTSTDPIVRQLGTILLNDQCTCVLLYLVAANTSCGLPLKMLRKTPMYTCGTYLVLIVPPPGGSGSSATRSLFGGTSGLSSLKSMLSDQFIHSDVMLISIKAIHLCLS